jgi:hypothetical protein
MSPRQGCTGIDRPIFLQGKSSQQPRAAQQYSLRRTRVIFYIYGYSIPAARLRKAGIWVQKRRAESLIHHEYFDDLKSREYLGDAVSRDVVTAKMDDSEDGGAVVD